LEKDEEDKGELGGGHEINANMARIPRGKLITSFDTEPPVLWLWPPSTSKRSPSIPRAKWRAQIVAGNATAAATATESAAVVPVALLETSALSFIKYCEAYLQIDK